MSAGCCSDSPALLPPEWRSYFEQQGRQSRLTEDGALQVPWDELRTRIVFWEHFLKQYPAFPLRESLQDSLDEYLGMWLGGVGSSAIADAGESGGGAMLLTGVRKSYERFLRDNKDSTNYSLVHSYYQLLAGRKFIPDQVTQDFLAKRKVRNYVGVEPPHY